MSNPEAVTKFAGTPVDGTFFVRKHDAGSESYALSVMYNGKVTHHLLKTPAAGVSTVNRKPTGVKGLNETVEFLREKRSFWPVPLGDHILFDEYEYGLQQLEISNDEGPEDLLTSECTFIVETPKQVYIWKGLESTPPELDYAKKVLVDKKLQLQFAETATLKPEHVVTEGAEPADFRVALHFEIVYGETPDNRKAIILGWDSECCGYCQKWSGQNKPGEKGKKYLEFGSQRYHNTPECLKCTLCEKSCKDAGQRLAINGKLYCLHHFFKVTSSGPVAPKFHTERVKVPRWLRDSCTWEEMDYYVIGPERGIFSEYSCYVWGHGGHLITWAGRAASKEDCGQMKKVAEGLSKSNELDHNNQESESGRCKKSVEEMTANKSKVMHYDAHTYVWATSPQYDPKDQKREASSDEREASSILPQGNITLELSSSSSAGMINVFKKPGQDTQFAASVPLKTFCPKLAALHSSSAPSKKTSRIVNILHTSADGLIMAVVISRKVYIFDVQSGTEITSRPIDLPADVGAVALAPRKATPKLATPKSLARVPTKRVIAIKLKSNTSNLKMFEFETDSRALREHREELKTQKATGQTTAETEKRLNAQEITTMARLSVLTDVDSKGGLHTNGRWAQHDGGWAQHDASNVVLHDRNYDALCPEYIINDKSNSEDQLAFSPDGLSLLVGGCIFPTGARIPMSIVSADGHLAQWSPSISNRLVSGSGQIVRVWDTQIDHCVAHEDPKLGTTVSVWRQSNFSIIQGASITAISESSDSQAIAIGFSIDSEMPEVEPTDWFPGESMRSVSALTSFML